jgi:hypothetical protein
MDNINGKNILEESEIDKDKSQNISKEEKKENDLIDNDDINIEDKPKKNEKDELKQNPLDIEIVNNNNNNNNNININKDNLPNNENNYSLNNQISKFKVPQKLKKTFIVSLILAGLGIILIILGFINAIADATPGGGIMFWVLGTIVIIPGGYYSYQFYKAKKTTDEYKRQDILDNIPEL